MPRSVVILLLLLGLLATACTETPSVPLPLADEPHAISEPSAPVEQDDTKRRAQGDGFEADATFVPPLALSLVRRINAGTVWPEQLFPEGRVPPVPLLPPIV